MYKKRVLIVCTGNSCRSQMAEGFIRHYGDEQFDVVSAGTRPSGLHPIAVQVMDEIGIDISRHKSKHVNEFFNQPFDYVITVCDHARKSCPFFPGKNVKLHWFFPDPPHHKDATKKVVKEFRKVRDLIHKKFKAAVKKGKFE